MRALIIRKGYVNLFVGTLIVATLSTVVADTLKRLTDFFEERIFEHTISMPWMFIFLPSVGITIIYFTRKYLFKGKQNKGIKEIFQTIEHRRNELPPYKLPSHYINGFLTVIFGGSTGVEVSTVVATAAVGASFHRRESSANIYKTELVCAGVAAGIATLFGSPIVGFLFAVEVIARKLNKTIALSCGLAVSMSGLFLFCFDEKKLFNFPVDNWHKEAIPFMILLCVLAGITAVYFTKAVIIIKDKFAAITNNFLRVNIGAVIVGISIFFLPQLFGDSYHAVPDLLSRTSTEPFSLALTGMLLVLVLLKPIIAALTLGAGGDGGVFAPSIVAGAMLGMLTAVVCNNYFGTHLIVINFALIGAAAMLSAAIHAPLTSLFLVCGIVGGGFILFVPVFMGVYISKYVAKAIFEYTVYSYRPKTQIIH